MLAVGDDDGDERVGLLVAQVNLILAVTSLGTENRAVSGCTGTGPRAQGWEAQSDHSGVNCERLLASSQPPMVGPTRPGGCDALFPLHCPWIIVDHRKT